MQMQAKNRYIDMIVYEFQDNVVLNHKALTIPLMSSATVSCIQIYLDFSSVAV